LKLVRNFTAALLLGLMSSPAMPQQQSQTEFPKLVENIDVRIINIDVVVTDRRGNIVTGLTKEDFLIFENGVPKQISNFFAVEGGRPTAVAGEAVPETPSPAAAPAKKPEIDESMKRRMIFYVDNLTLAPFNRNRVFTQMKEFIRTAMRPGDEAMIATFNRSMKVRVPFTKDTTTLVQALDMIAGESALGTTNTSERKSTEDRIRDAQSYDEAVATARTYASSIEHDLRQSAASLNGLMSTLAGLEGKKVLVLTSEGFPMQPGREMFQFIDEMAREKNWQFTGTLLEGMTYDSTSLIQSIAKTANANGITMYTIHAAGLTGGNEMSAENARPTPVSVSQAIVSNTTDSMQVMAQMTGGLASARTNNFLDAFKRIQRDLESYYSLGYRAGTERVDRQRYISVRLKEPKGYGRGRRSSRSPRSQR
jgi:VWFA-related protein